MIESTVVLPVYEERTKGTPPPFKAGITATLADRIRVEHEGPLQELAVPRDPFWGWRALGTIGYQFVVIGASAVACAIASARFHDFAVLFYLIACFVIGSRQYALGRMMHECAHRIFVPNERLNVFFGYLLSFIDMTDWETYCYEHSTHHEFLGHPQFDRDLAKRKRWLASDGRTFLWKHGVRPFSLFHLSAYLRPVVWCTTGSSKMAIARVVFLAMVLGAVQAFNAWAYFILFYVLPYLSAYQIFRYWSDALDHAGLLDSDEYFLRTRNHVIANRKLGAFLLPRGGQYPLVHHLFPWLPTHAYEAAHQYLLEVEPEYAKRSHTLRLREKI